MKIRLVISAFLSEKDDITTEMKQRIITTNKTGYGLEKQARRI
jgi:hypothetical protein